MEEKIFVTFGLNIDPITQTLFVMALKRFFAILAIIVFTLVYASMLKSQAKDPPFIQYMNHPWVDSVLKTLTPDQQIAQCIWVACWSDKDVSHAVEMSNTIKKYGVGGVVFFRVLLKNKLN